MYSDRIETDTVLFYFINIGIRAGIFFLQKVLLYTISRQKQELKKRPLCEENSWKDWLPCLVEYGSVRAEEAVLGEGPLGVTAANVKHLTRKKDTVK